MAEKTLISWTDRTANFWMGCVKASDGCKNCYAETFTRNRMGLRVFGPPKTTPRQPVKSVYANVRKWSREASKGCDRVLGPGKPVLVFVGSLMDWAEDHPDLDVLRERMWQTIRSHPGLHFQLLTKRADRIAQLLPEDWGEGYPNVWLGTSVEDMRVAWRVDELAKIPAVVRFISYEPALGPLDLSRWFGYTPVDAQAERAGCLSCGHQWRPNDRQQWPDLASCFETLDPIRCHVSPDKKATGGESATKRLPGNTRDALREASQRDGAPLGLAPFPRTDSAGDDHQSQEREARRQPTEQPGAGDLFGEPSTPHHAGQLQPNGRAQSQIEAHRCPACGSNQATRIRGDVFLDRSRLWRHLPGHWQDLFARPSPPLVTWCIYGGESGPGYRDHDIAWPRGMRDKCARAGVAFFYKQSPAFRTEMGIELDGQIVRAFPTPRKVARLDEPLLAPL